MTTNKINDGGPAFPFNVPSYSPQSTASYSASFPSVAYQLQPGMSLRDWFAGQSAPHILIELYGRFRRENQGVDNAYTIAALASYEMADAMLKAREAQS